MKFNLLFREYRRTLAAFLLPLGLYLLTLAPTIYNLDAAELTTAAATLGITRATGYPLYLLTGHLFSLLPLGDVGWRLNLFSAVCGALTVALLERCLRRWQVGGWAAFCALGLLATASHFWAGSLTAEVYTLQTALTALLVLCLLRWRERPTTGRLAAAGLVLGLGLSHHGATLLLLPGVVIFFLLSHPRRTLKPGAVAVFALATAAGASFYLYLPLRHAVNPVFNYAGLYDAGGFFHPVNLRSLAGLWWLVSGRAFAGEMFAYSGNALAAQTGAFFNSLVRSFFIIGIGPGLLGLGVLLRRDRGAALASLLMFTFHAFFFIDYGAMDKDTMFLPCFVIWCLWVGAGAQALLDWLAPTVGMPAWPGRALRGVLGVSVVAALAWNLPHVNRAQDWSARQMGEEILAGLPPGALVVGYWETIPVIQYLQFVEGKRPDVQAINRFLILPEDANRLVANRAAAGQPVYLDSLPDEFPPALKATREGLLYRIKPK